MTVVQPLHRARFATHWEVKPLLSPALPTDGVLLGTELFMLRKQFVAIRPTKQRRELGHTLIVGPTRCGKGLLAVSQLLTWQHSAIVNDIKGDLFNQTAGFRSLLGPVCVLDPTGKGHAYDPLHGSETEDDLLSGATQLLLPQTEEKDPTFTQRAIAMLTCIFMAAQRERAPALPYMRQMLRAGLRGCVERLQAIEPQLATDFLDTDLESADLTEKFLMSCWGTLKARTRPLRTETVIRSLARSDFTPEEIITSEKPVTIYMRWPEKRLRALAPLVKLLWASLIDEMIDTYDQRAGQGCNPVLLMVDEGGRTAIPSLADHATTIAGRNIYIWLAVQSLSQLATVYGPERAQTLRDNMESQIYYRPGDQNTAEYLERRLGRRSAYARSTTERQDGQASESHAEQAIPLLTAQDVQHLKDNEVIGFHRALPPFKLHRMDWRQHPILQKRRTVPQPTLPTLATLADLPTLQSISRPYYVSPDHTR
jgi:type IV secretion system protein VirD4